MTNQTNEELLAKVAELQAEILLLKKRKKYGLVWEDKPEEFEENTKNSLPILKEKGGEHTTIISNPELDFNILIEGDNYHSAFVLSYTHFEKIDGIYLDPPYNTGSTDWKYNNNYVDKNDSWRHSKWLSFMEKRLLLAKKLLKPDGILCVTIDDYEMPRLFMMLEEIFGEENHLGTIVIRNNPAGRSTVTGISITHEYALFFGKTPLAQVGRLERNEKQKSRYNFSDESGNFEWVNFRKPGSMRRESPKMFYPIFADEKSVRLPKVIWNEESQEWDLQEKLKKGESVLYPIDENGKERRWRWGIERAQTEISELAVKKVKDAKHIYVKGRTKRESILPMTWWEKKEYSATAYGTNLLKEIFSELQVFSYPKSIFAVKDCLRVLSEKKDATFLDFFAGSGTTGHAVLELNKEDDGNRKFILCTNDENGICEEVTYERIKRVIKGYKNTKKIKVSGLGGNLKYLKTDFIPKDTQGMITDEDRLRLTYEAGLLLALKENTFDEFKKTKSYQVFSSIKKITGVYFSENKEDLQEFLEVVNNSKKESKVYIFSWDKGAYKNSFSEFDHIVFEDIPEPILEVYKQLV